MTREALYDLVWSEPMADLAKRLGVSDGGLAKQCRRASVPVPPRGYWARLDAGQQVERTPLPGEAATRTHVVAVGSSRWKDTGKLADPQVAVPPPVPGDAPIFPDNIAELREQLRAKVKAVGIPPLARQRHPLLDKLLEKDEKRTATFGLPGYWPNPRYFESREEKRRMRLLNAIFIALERYGATPEVRDDRARDIGARVEGTLVSFRLEHPAVFRRRRAVSPTALEIRLGTKEKPRDDWGTWQEKNERLDKQLTSVVVGILLAGELVRREDAIARHRAMVEHERWLEADKRRKREEAERARVAQLLAEADALRRATEVRQLVAAAREANRCPPSAQGAPIEVWATWALGVADSLHPLMRQRTTDANAGRP